RRRPHGRQSRGGVRTPVQDRSERTRPHEHRYRGCRAICARLAGLFWGPWALWPLDARRAPEFATLGTVQRGPPVRVDPSGLGEHCCVEAEIVLLLPRRPPCFILRLLMVMSGNG